MIEKNTTIPVKNIQVFSAWMTNQLFTINVLQGEKAKASDNHKLGGNVEGIPAAPEESLKLK